LSDDIPIGLLLGTLFILLALSAFFSGTETALMALNRYRLKHKARSGNRGARYAEKLLERPDRLITLILFGNNLVNFTAAALVSTLTLRMGGAAAAAAGTFVFTLIVLIFAEVMPKTLAALHPEKLALPAAFIYYPLQKAAYPLIWAINLVSNSLLRLIGIDPSKVDEGNLTLEELRVLVNESGTLIPRKRHRMLQGILELEEVSVDEVMVPHNDIHGIDLDDDWDTIFAGLRDSQFTRLPIYRDSIDNVEGMLDLRKLRTNGLVDLDLAEIVRVMDEPYFVPENTPLHHQLIQFQHLKQRAALVVDEYGDIQGMVTLEDILTEIVGELSSESGPVHTDVTPEKNSSSYLVNASANVRSLNRTMNWNLPVEEATTLNGLILEQLEDIPETGTDFQLGSYSVEIVQTSENVINQVRIRPAASN
jgi:Mg2+/Co2+ transporter CorB